MKKMEVNHGAPYGSRTRLFRLKICGRLKPFNVHSNTSCHVHGKYLQQLAGSVGTVAFPTRGNMTDDSANGHVVILDEGAIREPALLAHPPKASSAVGNRGLTLRSS
jgi:hypothetical protein